MICLTNGKLKCEEPTIVAQYSKMLKDAAEEIVDFRFSLPLEERALIKEYEAKTLSNDHRDFVLRCVELLKQHPQLILEMRKIPAQPIALTTRENHTEAKL